MSLHGQILETPPARQWRWASEDDTAALAAHLARAMQAQPALAHALITLHGDLGAGKTTFVRHLLRALGVGGRIKSPTYAVVEPHQAPGGLRVAHFDFYRFSDPRELEDAGLRDWLAAPGLKLAEWPDKAAAWLPTADLQLHLRLLPEDDHRQALLSAHTALGAQLLKALPA